jgi:hypothetical protein
MGFMSRMAGTFDDKQRERLLTFAATDLLSAKPSDRVYLAAILAELAKLNENLERLTTRQLQP